MPRKKPSPPRPSEPSGGARSAARYSALSFQLAASVGLGFFLGHWLDGRVGNAKPYWAAGLAFLFLALGLYQLFRELLKK